LYFCPTKLKIMANIKIFSFNLFQEHTMLLWTTGPGCIAIDPGYYKEEEKNEFYSFLESRSLVVEAILLTHAHIDHTFAIKEVQDKFGGIPLYMNRKDTVYFEYNARMGSKMGLTLPSYDVKPTFIEDAQIISHCGLDFKVITTPGHSPGSVCYLEEKEGFILTGDTLFAGTIGRTDLEYGDYDQEIRSIMEKLIWLNPSTVIYPGHGPASTIGVERAGSPFLEPFNEKEELDD